MTTAKANKAPALRADPNPATGRPWRLTDPEIKAESAAELEAMRRDPRLAVRFLKDVGILNAKGKLAKRYGG